MSPPQRNASTSKELLTIFGAGRSPGSVTKSKKCIQPATSTSLCGDGEGHDIFGSQVGSSYSATSACDADLSSISRHESSSSQTIMDATSRLSTSTPFTANSVYYNVFDGGTGDHGSSMIENPVTFSTKHEQQDSGMANPSYADLFNQELPSYFHSSALVLEKHQGRSPDILSAFHGESYLEGGQEVQRDDSSLQFELGNLPMIAAADHTMGMFDVTMEDYIDPSLLGDTGGEANVHTVNAPNDKQDQSSSQHNIENLVEGLDDKRIRLFSPISGDDDPIIDVTPKIRRNTTTTSKRKTSKGDGKTPGENSGVLVTPKRNRPSSSHEYDGAEQRTSKPKSSAKKRRSTSGKFVLSQKSPKTEKRTSTRRSSTSDKKKVKQTAFNAFDL